MREMANYRRKRVALKKSRKFRFYGVPSLLPIEPLPTYGFKYLQERILKSFSNGSEIRAIGIGGQR